MSDNRKFTFEERVVADKVADELLEKSDKEDKAYFLLVLILLICLIFLVSSLSFAVFDTYYNGSRDNVSDVDIDVDSDYGKDDDKNGKDDNIISDIIIPSGHIDSSKIYFSYDSGSNYIKMDNVLPTRDDIGMNYSGDKQYFDFNIEALFSKKPQKKLVYEISIIPMKYNSIPNSDVRVYLTENKKGVSILNDTVNNFSDLPNSRFNENAKVIYRKVIDKNYSAKYIFRMWLSYDANISKDVKKFGCKIAVNAYSV